MLDYMVYAIGFGGRHMLYYMVVGRYIGGGIC